MHAKKPEEDNQRADKCVRGCRCQKGGAEACCKIKHSINDTVLFIASRCESYCPYQGTFGSAYTCLCPVRQELYRKNRT